MASHRQNKAVKRGRGRPAKIVSLKTVGRSSEKLILEDRHVGRGLGFLFTWKISEGKFEGDNDWVAMGKTDCIMDILAYINGARDKIAYAKIKKMMEKRYPDHLFLLEDEMANLPAVAEGLFNIKQENAQVPINEDQRDVEAVEYNIANLLNGSKSENGLELNGLLEQDDGMDREAELRIKGETEDLMENNEVAQQLNRSGSELQLQLPINEDQMDVDDAELVHIKKEMPEAIAETPSKTLRIAPVGTPAKPLLIEDHPEEPESLADLKLELATVQAELADMNAHQTQRDEIYRGLREVEAGDRQITAGVMEILRDIQEKINKHEAR